MEEIQQIAWESKNEHLKVIGATAAGRRKLGLLREQRKEVLSFPGITLELDHTNPQVPHSPYSVPTAFQVQR